MAKSTAEKLLLKPGAALWCSDAARIPLLGDLPEGVTVTSRLASATAAVVFVDSQAAARAAVKRLAKALLATPLVWFVYPKGGRADVNRDSLWPIVAEHGMRPITQVAVDETWSALRFRPLREDEPPFQPGASA
ncbi:MAG: hypothetical protein AMXMBFR23_04280 [Chloroflexota bacterium]